MRKEENEKMIAKKLYVLTPLVSGLCCGDGYYTYTLGRGDSLVTLLKPALLVSLCNVKKEEVIYISHKVSHGKTIS